MKTLIFSSLALVGLLLVGLQHHQIGELRAENMTLEQASAEASQLKADLAKSTGNEVQDAEEIERLREENHDLLKLRNEVNQLREARVQFEKVSAENQRLKSVAKSAPNPARKETVIQPILVLVANLANQGWSTPEATVQTIFWAQRQGNGELLSRSFIPEHRALLRDGLARGLQLDFQQIVSIEIVARRDIDAATVQLGIHVHSTVDAAWDKKMVVTLKLRGGDWLADVTTQ
jgi:hypothetical protein